MKVYVDELSKSCYVCPCYQQDKYHDSCQLGKFCIEQNQERFMCRHTKCPLQTIQSVQNEKAVECLEDVHKVLADAIIEITEPLENLDFCDLEKIARCFEGKIDQLIAELKGEKNE